MAVSLGELAARFGCGLIGDPSVSVSHIATLANADAGSISFLANPAYSDQLRGTQAAAVILREADAGDCPVACLISDDPYLVYARIAHVLHPRDAMPAGVHATAVIASTASIAETAHVGANVVIGERAVIGEGVSVGPGCVIGDDCNIGIDSRLIANVTLVQNVRIGARAIVHPGVVIGADGFGNAMSEEGWVKVPQIGGVSIGDDVEIGSNTTIDRGAIEDTIIGNGVKLDNLIMIAHNVRIGDHTAMAGMTGISGSTTIGKRCMFAGKGGTIGHLNICDDVVVTGLTMVTKDISEPGVYSGDFAAEQDRVWKRRVARFRRIESLTSRVAQLERAAREDDD